MQLASGPYAAHGVLHGVPVRDRSGNLPDASGGVGDFATRVRDGRWGLGGPAEGGVTVTEIPSGGGVFEKGDPLQLRSRVPLVPQVTLLVLHLAKVFPSTKRDVARLGAKERVRVLSGRDQDLDRRVRHSPADF